MLFMRYRNNSKRMKLGNCSKNSNHFDENAKLEYAYGIEEDFFAKHVCSNALRHHYVGEYFQSY